MVAHRSGHEPPAPLPDPGAGPLVTPAFAWVDDSRYLGVVTGGSSSCPAGPDAVDAVDEQVLEISVAPLPDADVCTADTSPHVAVVEPPRGVSPSEPRVARFEHSETTVEPVS